jgi:diaminohydroxyphosphoribosylaminopyrimidine deaminase/5-amino-6-(5-phosphoribosylamino)uracil reductase
LYQDKSHFYLSLALKEAWKYQILTFPNPPVGAIISIDDVMYSIGVHKKSGLFHAEVNAIILAYYKITKDDRILSITDANEIHSYLINNHKGIFSNATLYVTLEPCNHYGKTPPCSNLIKELSFKKVVIGSSDISKPTKSGHKFLDDCNIDVDIGCLKKECDFLIYPFNIMQQGTFVFFKYAQTLNGKIKGGYISSQKSLKLVHKIRDKIDLLVIGGNTVRVDRPTLDARLCGGKSPDILIYSKQSKFDKTIPLFNVPNRDVYIENSLDKIYNYKSVMIEGGNGMLESTKNIIDYILLFTSPQISNTSDIKCDINLEFLNVSLDRDLIVWSKVIKNRDNKND